MSALLDLASFSFHDASLTGASSQNSALILDVEYYDQNDEEAKAAAAISGIETILRDGVPVKNFNMETADGEIYQLSQEGHEVTLIMIWHHYSPHSRVMHTYTMRGTSIRLSAERR